MDDIRDFWKKYELVASTTDYQILTAQPKVCRFCNNIEPVVAFKTTTHIIPELLGRNTYISEDECDECNNKFSALESHLSAFFRPYLTMVGVKGKKKIPSFQSRTENNDEKTRTLISASEKNKRIVNLQQLSDYKVDQENKTISIRFRKPPHKPFFVYKALVKIALSILPKEKIDEYQNVFNWLLDKPSSSDYFITAFITVLSRNKFERPFSELYCAKNIEYEDYFIPEATLLVGFGNVFVQIFLPLSSKAMKTNLKDKTPEMNLYPSFIFNFKPDDDNFIINAIDLKSRKNVTYDETLVFSFGSGDFNIPQ